MTREYFYIAAIYLNLGKTHLTQDINNITLKRNTKSKPTINTNKILIFFGYQNKHIKNFKQNNFLR